MGSAGALRQNAEQPFGFSETSAFSKSYDMLSACHTTAIGQLGACTTIPSRLCGSSIQVLLLAATAPSGAALALRASGSACCTDAQPAHVHHPLEAACEVDACTLGRCIRSHHEGNIACPWDRVDRWWPPLQVRKHKPHLTLCIVKG